MCTCVLRRCAACVLGRCAACAHVCWEGVVHVHVSLDPAPFLHAQGGALGEKRAWYPLSAHALL